MFNPITVEDLSTEQRALIEEIAKRLAGADRQDMWLSVHVQGADLVFISAGVSDRLSVSPFDVEQLCRAGLLIGQYDGGKLHCSLASKASSFLEATTHSQGLSARR